MTWYDYPIHLALMELVILVFFKDKQNIRVGKESEKNRIKKMEDIQDRPV